MSRSRLEIITRVVFWAGVNFGPDSGTSLIISAGPGFGLYSGSVYATLDESPVSVESASVSDKEYSDSSSERYGL